MSGDSKTAVIEISVRLFFTADTEEADITPKATFKTNSSVAADIIGSQVSTLRASLEKMVTEMPMKTRPMTIDEVNEFIAGEAS